MLCTKSLEDVTPLFALIAFQYLTDSGPSPEKSDYRNVWSAAELQAKNEEWQLVCANVFGLEWSQ